MLAQSIRCPNHNEPLIGITAKDLAAGRGANRCPVSNQIFEWQADATTEVKDKFGNVYAKAIVTGND